MSEPTPISANDFIEQQIDERLREIEEDFSAAALSLSGAILSGTDDIMRAAVESKRNDDNRDNLVVILHSPGGYIGPAQRIVETLRHHYEHVDFVVPNYAYSAATILAMSGDAIWMDYYSRLGPIDPQVESRSGQVVPALGYLERYNALIAKASEGKITPAEVQLLIDGFDQAELYQYEHAREYSVILLTEWLVKYKFKHWTETEEHKKPVTDEMRGAAADKVARTLNDTKRWHSHGFGISKDVLQNDVGLKINDFSTDPNRREKIRAYHALFDDYMIKRGHNGALHVVGSYQPFL